MYTTLKGVFPESKKEPQRNFIKENVKHLKIIQEKNNEPKFLTKPIKLTAVKSSRGNPSLMVPDIRPSGSKKKISDDMKIRKGDMSEFLKRKELRMRKKNECVPGLQDLKLQVYQRDMACQTVESELAHRMDNTRLTVLYPKKEGFDDEHNKYKASGDSSKNRSPITCRHLQKNSRCGDADNEKKTHSTIENKDMFLPPGYQKGVLPKYLRERKQEQEVEVKPDGDVVCPPGHVALPDTERKETLRMLRNSFAELVGELNKMPVRTDTLRMRNRKIELEKQLAKLEEGIKVFSRPKVFVKIGE